MNPSLPLFAVCERPVFIITLPHSGTTLMRRSLCQHAEFWCAGDGDFLQPVITAISAAWQRGNRYGPLQCLPGQNVDENEFWRFAGLGFNALYTSRAGSRRWIEKTPGYACDLGELARLFPRSQFIYIHRNGRDVVSSICRKWGWSYRRACRLWRDCTNPVLRFEQHNPQKIQRVCFEQLMQNPVQTLEDTLRFLKAPPSQACVRYFEQHQPQNFNESADKLPAEGNPLAWLKPNWLKEQWFERTCGNLQMRLGYR